MRGSTPATGESAERDLVSLNRAAVLGIEYVRQIPVDGHADREGAAGTDYLLQPRFIATDPEDRDAVAPGVDRNQNARCAI